MGRTTEMNALFDRIAPSYDRVTRLISLGRDSAWRTSSINCLRQITTAPSRILDACCGTGEYTLLLRRAFPGAAITALDFSQPMLQRARAKAARRQAAGIQFVRGDLNRLPFGDSAFNLATVAFGLRNSVDYRRSLLELRRVLKPGGLLFILEFATPGRSLFTLLFEAYFHLWVPLVGLVLGRSFKQYGHLPKSVGRFGDSDLMESRLRASGFDPVTAKPLFRDIVYQYAAWKDGDAPCRIHDGEKKNDRGRTTERGDD